MMKCTARHTLSSKHSARIPSCRSRVPLTPRSAMAPEARVSFQSTARQKLAGVYTDAGRNDVVILCHGYAGSKDGFVYPAMAKALALKGFSSLRFDFSGNGESEGAFVFAGYHQEAADLRCAVQYVRETLHKKVVAIVGHSKGGNVVLLYASQYDDVPLVINIAGRFHMTRGVKERFGEEVLSKVERLGEVPMTVKTDTGATVKWLLTKQVDPNHTASAPCQGTCRCATGPSPSPLARSASSMTGVNLQPMADAVGHRIPGGGRHTLYMLPVMHKMQADNSNSLEERMSLDMEAAARKITLSEVFSVHGTADTVIPPADSEALSKCVRQHQLWLVPGADHNFRTTGSADQLIRKVVAYIAEAQ